MTAKRIEINEKNNTTVDLYMDFDRWNICQNHIFFCCSFDLLFDYFSKFFVNINWFMLNSEAHIIYFFVFVKALVLTPAEDETKTIIFRNENDAGGILVSYI